MSLKNNEEKKKRIRAVLVIEMIGRPFEYLVESINKSVEEMGKEKGIEIISKNIKEPMELKENKDFFSTFAEIEVEVEEIIYLEILIFKYMPAHIEIIEPELIAMTNNKWNDLFNEITRRLHAYDEVARVLQIQNMELRNKINELMPKEKISEEKPKGKKK